MLISYIKTALRHIWRHRVHSILNIIGLTVGMACTIIILLWVRFEFSFDHHHENADRIYRLITDFHFGSLKGEYAVSGHAAGPTLQRDLPEVEKAVRFHPVWGSSIVRCNDKQFVEQNLFYADNTVFDVFTFTMLRGNPKSALRNAYSAVITEGMAAKIFGNDDPLGKVIKISNVMHSNLHNAPDFTVTGVIKKWPLNSHFNFDILLSFETIYVDDEAQRGRWTKDIDNYTYLLLKPDCDYQKLESKLPALVERHLTKDLQDMGVRFDLLLQPLTRIHLYSKQEAQITYSGFIEGVVAFTAIAVVILMIACINFINLTTARSADRAREIGIRKTLGADQRSLVVQFIGEGFSFSIISLFLALGLVELLIPLFRAYFPWGVNFENIYSPGILAAFFALALTVGVTAGSYPAFLMSAFQPLQALKGGYGAGAGRSRFRSLLVVFQFTVSITLIIATVVVFRQFDYMQNKALGFDRERVVVVQIVDAEIRENIELVKTKLKKHRGIAGIGFTSHQPGRHARTNVYAPEGFAFENMQKMDAVSVDTDFVPTMGVELVAGQNFSSGKAVETSRAVLINETAARQFGWTADTAVGKTITELSDDSPVRTIVGVMKDFHQRNLYNPIQPLHIENSPETFNFILIKIRPDYLAEAIAFLESKWKEIDPIGAFDYWFLDEQQALSYEPMKKLGILFVGFAFLAVFIACMGLFGLVMFTAGQRTKEIGVRKALGATVADIALMLSKSFAKWVLVANICAWPLTYWFIADWLEDYSYRIDVGIGIYVYAGLLALAIAMLTVSYQVFKTARSNPVDSLRYE